MRVTLLFIAAALATPVAGTAQIPTTCQRASGTSAYPAEARPGYNHDRFGVEPRDLFLEFGAFVSSFIAKELTCSKGVGCACNG